jgi:hypothetical protein
MKAAKPIDVSAGRNINQITVSTQMICEHLAEGD